MESPTPADRSMPAPARGATSKRAEAQLMSPSFWLKSHFHRIAAAIVGTSDGRKMIVPKNGCPITRRFSRIARASETRNPAGTEGRRNTACFTSDEPENGVMNQKPIVFQTDERGPLEQVVIAQAVVKRHNDRQQQKYGESREPGRNERQAFGDISGIASRFDASLSHCRISVFLKSS